MKIKHEILKNPVKVTIPINQPAWINGLKRVVSHNDRQGYQIGIYRCPKCQQEISFKHKPTMRDKWCPKCGKELKLQDVMPSSIVKDIVSRQLGYACPECGKVYRQPTDCCIAKSKLTLGEVIEYKINNPKRLIL